MPVTQEFTTTIPSDTAEGQRVQEQIVQLLEERNFSPRDVFSVRLALEEALVNAIKHGNGMDPDKRVHVECFINAKRVRIVIQDEGEGFDPSSVPDPTADENLERPCGRGIMLMKSFMDSVEYCDSGTRVIMEKHHADGSTGD
jgi:serine/threonine-protein kinase RsbW